MHILLHCTHKSKKRRANYKALKALVERANFETTGGLKEQICGTSETASPLPPLKHLSQLDSNKSSSTVKHPERGRATSSKTRSCCALFIKMHNSQGMKHRYVIRIMCEFMACKIEHPPTITVADKAAG